MAVNQTKRFLGLSQGHKKQNKDPKPKKPRPAAQKKVNAKK
jgi:hypothetical protein